jgi:hypothetical protein
MKLFFGTLCEGLSSGGRDLMTLSLRGEDATEKEKLSRKYVLYEASDIIFFKEK